ncbi:MAG: hypothetical protein HUU26_08130 [Gemmatimonadaceae bacterium]|nr:hypothetical protein [Gemmatimonadaceae bacterium]
MSRSATLAERIAGFALPRGCREEILGDLLESGRGAGWLVRESVRIGVRYHGECYRDADDRLRIALLFALAAALVWIIPEATARTFGGTSLFTDPVTLAIVAMWRAAHLTSAAAAGLLLGRSALVASHASPSRAHVALGLIGLLFLLHPVRTALAASAALMLAAWIGTLARRSAEGGVSPDDSLSAG